MPNIQDTKPVPPVNFGKNNNESLMSAPEYQGRSSYDPNAKMGDSNNCYAERQTIFSSKANTKYRVVFLNPEVVTGITHMPTFFNSPTVPKESYLMSKDFEDGMSAWVGLKEKITHIQEDKHFKDQNMTYKNVTALVLSKTGDEPAVVRGVVEAQIGKTNTQYFVSANPNPSTLQLTEPDNSLDRN